MSQRVVTTISSLSSAGMPIFQSSGLVPLHNATYSMQSAPMNTKISLPDTSAISSSGSLQARALDVTGSTSSTQLASSSALAQLLQMGISRMGEVKTGLKRDHIQPLAKSIVGHSSANVCTRTEAVENPYSAKLGPTLDYPSIDFHSSTSQGTNPLSEWVSYNPARAFKSLANYRAKPDTESKASSKSDGPSLHTEEPKMRIKEHICGAEKRSAGSRTDANSNDSLRAALIKGDYQLAIGPDSDTKEWHTKKLEKEDEEEEWVTMENNPFNMRIVNLNNFPIAQSVYRTNYRSHSVACVRAKLGSIQNTAKSLDLLRQILQKSINAEIDVILKKYTEEYFQPALENIRLNNGDNAVSVEHVNNVCRQILEEAKKMFNSDTRSGTPDILDNASDSGSTDDARYIRNARGVGPVRRRKLSSGSESSSCAPKTKKKGRIGSILQTSSGRSTPSKKLEPVRREGPMWDSERIRSDTLFVMGARANKALGLGATRGRLYIKHPEVFKYCADQDDKQWLYEKHLMPATGGKTYLLLVEDIKDLAQSDEYRNSPGLLLDEVVGFTAPDWMLEKMRSQMNAMRTDTYKGSHLSRDLAATEALPRPSPANSETREMSTEQDYEDDSRAVSPLNETGGFNQEPSPAPSQAPSELTNAEDSDEETPMTRSFYVS